MQPLRHISVFVCALLFAGSFACAQFKTSLATANSSDSSSADSSSSAFSFASPARTNAQKSKYSWLLAPAGGGSGGGQSDKKDSPFSFSNIALEAGAGFNGPFGNDNPYITWGGNFTAGAGLHFSNRLALLAEYQFIGDKLPGAFVALGGGTGGNAHIWSLTLDPVLDLFPKGTNGAYITGGGGFYRKLTSFTVLVCCDFYGYPVSEVANHFSSNQGGFNVGFGLTHRLGGTYNDGTMKLFAEARYLYVDTPKYNAFTGPIDMGTTELIPVTFGVRW
jgi:hypothetical protein